MMSFLIWLLLFVIFLLLVIKMVISFIRVYKRNQIVNKLPRVGAHWLLGGMLWDIPVVNVKNLMMKTVQYGEEKGGIYNGFIGTVPFIVLNDGKYIKQICQRSGYDKNNEIDGRDSMVKNFGYDVSQVLIGTGLLTSEGSFWKHQRSILEKGFHKSIINKVDLIVNPLLNDLIQNWNISTEEPKTIEIFNEITKLAADSIGMFGFNHKFDGILRKDFKIVLDGLFWYMWWEETVLSFLKHVPTNYNRRFQKHLKSLKEKIVSIIIEKKNSLDKQENNVDQDDYSFTCILDLLLMKENNEYIMTVDQIYDEAITFIFAGEDTTSSTITWMLYLLSTNPDVQNDLYSEISAALEDQEIDDCDENLNNLFIDSSLMDNLPLLNAVFKETLRLYPPAIIGRRAIKDTNVGGYEIPKNCNFFINLYALHRLSHWGEDSNEFKPERWLDEDYYSNFKEDPRKVHYFPFGGTPRKCIGETFARKEIKIVICKLISLFEFKKSKNHKDPLLWPSITLHPTSTYLTISKR
eukprot:TRINITY_DN334_c2_g2_i1.p1 TRINITY_DN334_c2_g2~~TRINITY_DN334_c2_g2_i1.p1  ORF type:complete len:521 (-),score=110.70 TRINITY_DN334_c2_g2_i1:218-1780(-)